ncbi:conserved phage C-terminal domain-containing protein [Tuberibacillus sp. Marseille-P3662]|uniref:conserved phage C-terminal domain-containing protein n=1 Tax=Tuberibacillus sp. Marseille-P3662 TaxID=1965358 RepID=UPI000A1C8565|nr:conserved phage C-terminal domain-containing protein [Tuberibacillus sp. Marseille-P3662]
MAKFRQIHTTFWQDPKVLEEMTPEDKYFYLYLLTNPNTTQIGVYQITRKQMAFDLGYSIESVRSLLERFVNHHKVVKYNENTREIAVINWGKYNLHRAGKPVIDLIAKELESVKDKSLLQDIAQNVHNEAILDQFSRYVDDTWTVRGQEEEEEEEEEKEEEIEEEKIPYVEIVNYLNSATGSKYRAQTNKTRSLIKARWNEGFRFNDFKLVIEIKTHEWVNDPKMSKFLRPETLFGTKFESYLNQDEVGEQNAVGQRDTSQYENLF